VPFDSFRDLSNAVQHSPNVFARGTPILTVGSGKLAGTESNAGAGTCSQTSMFGGDVIITSGSSTVSANKHCAAYHGSETLMNVGPGGANTKGMLVTDVGTPTGQVQDKKVVCNDPPKSSQDLEKLTQMKESLKDSDPAQLDEWIRTNDAQEIVGGWINQMRPANDSGFWGGVAGAGRGILNVVNRTVFGLADLLKLMAQHNPMNPMAMIHDQLNMQILAENIKLGNICLASVKEAAKAAGKQITKPMEDAWARGDHVQAITEGGIEIAMLVGPIVTKLGQIAKAGQVARAAEAEKALELERAASEAQKASQMAAAQEAIDGHNAKKAADAAKTTKPKDGVTIEKASAATIAARRKLAEDFYRKRGFSEDSIKEHTKGIDFEKPVQEVTLKEGTELVQYQVPGGRQGSYYAHPGTEPDGLGIAAQAQDRATGAIVDKIGAPYKVTADTPALQSTSASIKDTWSIPGREIQTSGGKTQFFTTDKTSITK